MLLNDLIETLNISNFIDWSVKAFGILFAFFYVFFAIVVFNQIKITEKTITISHQYIFYLLAIIHVIIGLVLVLYSILIL